MSCTLLEQAWVDDVAIEGGGRSASLRISVNDAEAAQTRLQRVLLTDDELVIKAFSRPTATLEDVFIDLVEEGPDE